MSMTLPNGLLSPSKWVIKSQTSANQIHEEIFDCLIVASGTFSKPYVPETLQDMVDPSSGYHGKVLRLVYTSAACRLAIARKKFR